jgi:cobalt-zinc-cadmium efflux system membrane fusion protein
VNLRIRRPQALRAYALVAAVDLALSLGCQTREEPPSAPALQEQPEKSDRVQVDPELIRSGRIALTEVTRFAHSGKLAVPGEVVPAADGFANVGTLVSGRIASLDAVEGDQVKKGRVLAWIDAPEIGGVRADLARAEALTLTAEQRLARQLALQSQGATSQSAVDEARSAVASAHADKQAAKAKLGASGAAGTGSTGRIPLRAPIDGTIVERNAILGGSVTPDATLFSIVNPQKLRVRAQWAESFGPPPSANSEAHLSFRYRGAGSATCTGTLETHLGVIAPLTRSMTLQIRPDTTCSWLTAGSYVDVFLPTAQSAAAADEWVQVPLEAVVDLRGVPVVFVEQANTGEFIVRHIDPKPSMGDVVPVASGLEVGEKVATKGVVLLKGEALRDILGGD